MADRVLLSASPTNIEDCVDLAIEHQLGIEVMNFSIPAVLDGNWEHDVRVYRTVLRHVPGMVTLHGPFMDMVSGSPDPRINAVSFQRYQHTIHITSELEASLLVLHANFIGSMHNTAYRKGWHERSLQFWESLAERARYEGVTIVLENMWEYDPSIIADVLREINHPNLLACLDVGHAYVFGDKSYTIDDWINTLKPWLVHTHVNNNDGTLDEHHSFNWKDGVIDYHAVLPKIRALPYQPSIVLEMYTPDDMRESLPYMELEPTPDQT